MGGGRDLPLHVELEHAFRPGGPFLAESQFVVCTGAPIAFPNEADVGVRVGRRPVVHEIFEKAVPTRQTVALEVTDRERESMVDADNDRVSAQNGGGAVLRDLEAAPVPRAFGRRRYFPRRPAFTAFVDLQRPEPAFRGLRSGIVDADVTLKFHAADGPKSHRPW